VALERGLHRPEGWILWLPRPSFGDDLAATERCPLRGGARSRRGRVDKQPSRGSSRLEKLGYTAVSRVRFAGPCLIALLAFSPGAAGQDFDPGGRRPRPPAVPGGHRPRPPKPPGKKKPDVAKLIKRYTAILLAKPHEAFPLQKLTQLYRQRDGKLDQLIAEFEKRSTTSGPDQFNAKLALAGIYVQAQRKADATPLLEAAVKDRPKLATPRLMLAQLAQQGSDHSSARTHFEAALPLMKKGVEKERVVRALMLLCVELKDFAAARKHHANLVRLAGGSLFVKKELGRELLHRGHHALAEEEFRKILRASAGDNRALAPALRDLGKALAKQKKMTEALKVLKRARRIAGAQAGIRNEILVLLTEVYREQGKLIELIAILESEPGRDFQRLATVGSLYEETGQVDKALSTYRTALTVDRRNIDVRVKLVHLLQTAGQLDEAIKEYEALIKAAPHNADFVFELAETLIQRGDRDKALKLAAALERRSGRDGEILAAVADFYERIEEQDRAIKVLERLAKLPSGDPQYVIDLGDRYYQQGEKKRAEATWLRVRRLVPNRARAASILGEVYLDHDMPAEALTSFREAVKLAPQRTRYRKQLAVALERTAAAVRSARYRYREALTIWEDLLDKAGDNQLLSRECRTHIVSLWAILRQLKDKIGPLNGRLASTPPDLEAGRLLAEVQRRLHKLADAEKTLRTVVKHAPGDEAAFLALERVLVMQRNLTGAIEVLEKLVEVNPKRARQYYQRMAQYSVELYRDDDAIKYAARAVELSPNDAVGHYNLGKMYRRRQDNARAMQEFRNAISKNDRLYRAYFALAEMLLSSGKVEDADRLYRHVVRASRDEEFVMRAARESRQINLGKGTLESLERELLPVALGHPQKPVYRRLLVELYGAMTFPLVHAARLGKTKAAIEARQQLAKIGARAVKPLLDAIADPQVSQQRIAIEVLAYVQNKGAGPALFNFALSQAERELRVRAMVACGALADTALLPRYRKLLAPSKDGGQLAPGDAVAVAAAWGVARMGGGDAEPLLLKLLASPSPDIRALAAVGLGLTKNKRHAEVLAKLARSPEAGPTARAAAAHALGELEHEAQRPLLMALTDSAEPQVKWAALLALSRGWPRTKPSPITIPEEVGSILAREMLGETTELRRTAMAAATALTTGSYRRSSTSLPVPHGIVVVSDVLRGLVPTGYSRKEQAQAVIALKDQLTKAAQAAVATSPGRARVVAGLVLTGLEPLIDGAPGDELSPQLARDLAATSEAIGSATVTGFVALARHPSVEVRKRAIELLAQRREPEAQEALVSALNDADSDVCKTALSAVTIDNAKTVAAVIALLSTSNSWSIRARAAEALGRLGPAVGPSVSDQAGPINRALEAAATTDDFALVREAAVRSIAKRDPPAAKALLQRIGTKDPEPLIRKLAADLAVGQAKKDAP
jgi:tetratricopeptide (TPR) repeat protein